MVDAGPKVVSLRGEEIRPPGEPRQSVIDALEAALEAARSGEVIGVSMVLNHSDNTLSGAGKGKRGYETVGMLEIVKADLVDGLREDS